MPLWMAEGGPIFNRRLSVGQSAHPVQFTSADYSGAPRGRGRGWVRISTRCGGGPAGPVEGVLHIFPVGTSGNLSADLMAGVFLIGLLVMAFLGWG